MDLIPTVTQEAVSQCKAKGVIVSPAVVSLYLRTQLLVTGKKDPVGNVEVKPNIIESLVASAVAALTKENQIMVDTLRLQSTITTMQQEQINAYRTEKIQHKAKSQRLIEDICAKKEPGDVFMSIALYILHESRMLDNGGANNTITSNNNNNSSSNQQSRNGSRGGFRKGVSQQQQQDGTTTGVNEVSQKETITALESVFPKVHMKNFATQRDQEKMRQLEEIWRIVWGIRLFNKSTQKGGSDIPNLLEDTDADLVALIAAAEALKAELWRIGNDYSAVLRSPSLHFTDAQRQRLQDEYQQVLQAFVYIRSLLETLAAVQKKLKEFAPKWDHSLNEAQQLVQGSETSPVPKSAVYPKFIFISERWDTLLGLQREVQDATELFRVIQDAVTHAANNTTLRPTDVEAAHAGMASERIPNTKLIAAEVDNLPGGGDGKVLEYLPTLPVNDQTGKPKETHLEFNGFCIVSFVDHNILLHGKKSEDGEDATAHCPGYIHLHTNNAIYSFHNDRCLKAFARDPFRYLSQGLMELVQANPTTVYLLGLHPYLPKEIYLTGTRAHEVSTTVDKTDDATQTGQIDPYKDTHYVWNEWELRRLALQLAALRNKRTKSSQTALSHFRRDNDTQAYLPKDQTTQTAVDAAIQPPRVRQYLKGLRGTESSEIEVVQKTFLY